MTKESLLKPGDSLSKSSGSCLALTLDVQGTVRVLITMICKVIYLSFSAEVASTLVFNWILEELLTHTSRPLVIECFLTAFNSNMDLLAGTHSMWVELLLKDMLCLLCWLCWGLVLNTIFYFSEMHFNILLMKVFCVSQGNIYNSKTFLHICLILCQKYIIVTRTYIIWQCEKC